MRNNTLKTVVFITLIAISISSCKSTTKTADTSNRSKGSRDVGQIIESMDTDNDGKLTIEEVKGPLKNDFAKIDTNEDGFITKEELENAPKPQRRGPGGGRRN